MRGDQTRISIRKVNIKSAQLKRKRIRKNQSLAHQANPQSPVDRRRNPKKAKKKRNLMRCRTIASPKSNNQERVKTITIV